MSERIINQMVCKNLHTIRAQIHEMFTGRTYVICPCGAEALWRVEKGHAVEQVEFVPGLNRLPGRRGRPTQEQPARMPATLAPGQTLDAPRGVSRQAVDAAMQWRALPA